MHVSILYPISIYFVNRNILNVLSLFDQYQILVFTFVRLACRLRRQSMEPEDRPRRVISPPPRDKFRRRQKLPHRVFGRSRLLHQNYR